MTFSKKSFLTLLAFIGVFFLNKKSVFASTLIPDTTCSGSFNCQITTCTWSGGPSNGQTCENENEVLFGGICVCNTSNISRSCTTQGSDCLIQDVDCTSYDVSTCSFVPAPTPTPTPPSDYCGDGYCNSNETCDTCSQDCGACAGPPPPPPPGWGACGSCSNCGFTASECQLNPSGQCVWNPATCGGGGGGGNGQPGCCDENGEAGMNGWCSVGPGLGSVCSRANCCAGLTCNPEWRSQEENWDKYYCSCNPSCGSPRCGGSDGCGGTCSNADAYTPWVSAVNPSGSVTTNGSGQVTVTWNGKATYYTLRITGTGGTGSDHVINTTTSSHAYTFTAQKPFYQVYVSGTRTTCWTTSTSWVSTSFNVNTPLSGVVYFDQNAEAQLSGGLCTLSGSPPGTQPGTSATVDATYTGGSDSVNVDSNGNYSLTLPFGVGLVDAELIPEGYSCSCPVGCSYSGLSVPLTGANYFVTDLRDPWWQIIGGSAYAQTSGGTAISSQIPTTCASESFCKSFASTLDDDDTAQTSGVLVTGGGLVDVSGQEGVQVDSIDEDGKNYHIEGSLVEGIIEGYDFFYRLYSMGVNPSDDYGAAASNAQKPTSDPSNGRAYYVGGDMTTGADWNVTSGEEIVVFVNGDLNLNHRTNVDVGGFLAFIVSGDINISSDLGNSADAGTHTTAAVDKTGVVEGVYVADGNINIAAKGEASGGDDTFVGEGIFVGWSGVVLARDYRDGALRGLINNVNPVEIFRYRPDFIANIPRRMTRAIYEWREVAP